MKQRTNTKMMTLLKQESTKVWMNYYKDVGLLPLSSLFPEDSLFWSSKNWITSSITGTRRTSKKTTQNATRMVSIVSAAYRCQG